jgi:hypothetical protein
VRRPSGSGRPASLAAEDDRDEQDCSDRVAPETAMWQVPARRQSGSGRPAGSWEGMTQMRSVAEIVWLQFLGDVDAFRERLGAALY